MFHASIQRDIDLTPIAPRRIIHRTRGRTHGPITRLMSPGDLGHHLKPFVFLDHFDMTNAPFTGMNLHPHSGIATATWLFEGSIRFEDTTGEQGVLRAGSLEWFKAARGAWHGGGPDGGARTRGFQLWLALPPEQELAEVQSIYTAPQSIEREGPATKLLGVDDGSAISPPSPLTYRAVTLRAGEDWRFEPPPGQTVAWCAVSRGELLTPEPVVAGELALFEQDSAPIHFRALSDTEFVVGAAVPHPHDLVLGYYSVHTSPETLEAGERRILEVREDLRAQGRL